jgi:hypothetical protein
MTWDRQLYFPSEGRRAEDFFALKNPTGSNPQPWVLHIELYVVVFDGTIIFYFIGF